MATRTEAKLSDEDEKEKTEESVDISDLAKLLEQHGPLAKGVPMRALAEALCSAPRTEYFAFTENALADLKNDKLACSGLPDSCPCDRHCLNSLDQFNRNKILNSENPAATFSQQSHEYRLAKLPQLAAKLN